MELTTYFFNNEFTYWLFMMSKIQNLNGTHNGKYSVFSSSMLFMMSKIQNLNGTHNSCIFILNFILVVYDVKDTKFEWNSQPFVNKWVEIKRCL